ncbi:MAG: glycosyltransferase [Acidobacteriota bacterium]|nr:glycosyltransferase [Acidobacteriota bacterium]
MKIAILGTRGVPPNYGGFETMAAELSARLIARGHEMWVYCREIESAVGSRQSAVEPGGLTADRRPPTADSSWNGIHRIVLPTMGHKYFETVSHSFLSAMDALRRDFDAVLICNAANAFVLPLLRAARIPVAINVDGIERKRRKWNVLGRMVYAIGEAFSVSFANAVVADAEVIADYYRKQYSIEPAIIPYGAEFPVEEDSDVLERLGLRAGEYLLYVSRFEPENNPLETVEAYERTLNTEHGTRNENQDDRSVFRVQRSVFASPPLVMLGKGLYAPDLVAELHRHASDRVLFPGALYGRDYRTLQRNALLYIQATEVGGTHPALIEAMASGGCVLAHDTPENREVGGDTVGYFRLRPTESLSGTIQEWVSNPLMRQDFRVRARKRTEEKFSWDRVTDDYEKLFESIGRHGRLR